MMDPKFIILNIQFVPYYFLYNQYNFKKFTMNLALRAHYIFIKITAAFSRQY